MNILVTGGAGYIGCVLVPELLNRGHRVRVLDNLMFDGRGLLPYFSSPNFEFQKGDVRREEDMVKALRNMDLVIHLAAIVGYPACKQRPDLAQTVNVDGTKLLEKLRKRDVPVLFGSTGSNYGALVGDLCTEETPLNPLTIYGKTKTEAERYLLERGNVVCYRFATAFGVSNRLRLDLLVNDFCYQAKKMRNLIIYEKSFKRTFIHVRDIARAFVFAIENLDRMRDQTYNVGSEKMNMNKEEVALKIKEYIDYYLHFADVGEDEDKRNYEVSYEKIRKLGFDVSIAMGDGIQELLHALDAIEIKKEFSNV